VDETTRIRIKLASVGTPIGNNNAAIAGHALVSNAVLVTNNVRESVYRVFALKTGRSLLSPADVARAIRQAPAQYNCAIVPYARRGRPGANGVTGTDKCAILAVMRVAAIELPPRGL